MYSTGRVEIDRLRARLREGGETSMTGLRLGSMLAGADLHPRGFPPSAVLIVRRLDDPMPGRLRGPASIAPSWERSVREELEARRRAASRPSRGVIAGDADAVLFADEAEMLAALSLDLVRGRAGDRWWWKVPLRDLRSAGSRQLPRLLQENVRHLPAVLDYARAWNVDREIVRSLAPDDALRLVDALCAAYELPGVTTGDARFRGTMPLAYGAGEREQAEERFRWERLLLRDAAPSALGDERRLLLGFAAAIHREPAIARSAPFLGAVRRWWSERLEQRREDGPREDPIATREHSFPADDLAVNRKSAERGAESEAPLEAASDHAPRSGPDQPTAADSPRSSASASSRGQTSPADESGSAEQSDAARRDFDAPAEDPAMTPASSLRENGSSAQPAHAIANDGEDESGAMGDPAGDDEAGLVPFPSLEGAYTELAGIFFLIDLMLYLDLPDLFESEWRLASRLGPWGTLDALARWLLAVGARHITDDPVWEVLGQLDRREKGTPPGADFKPSKSFHLPASWLDDGLSGEILWSADGEMLRIWSSRGYPIVESPRDAGAPEIQLRRELAPYATVLPGKEPLKRDSMPALIRATGPLVAGLGEGLSEGLARIAPYLLLRLASAFGLEPGDRSMIDAMMRRRGRIYATSTHVDLVMSLDDVWLPVRLAGLDRDPGWSPRFGRVIQFHFE